MSLATQAEIPSIAVHSAAMEIGGDRPLMLSGGGGWWVEQGSVDVFRVKAREGSPVGARHALFRAGAGALVLRPASVPDDLALIAVATSGTIVREIDAEALEGALGRADGRAALAPWLEGWIERVCSSMDDGMVPKDCREIEAGEYKAKQTTLVRSDQVLWIRAGEGTEPVHLLDAPELRIGDLPVPVSPPLRLTITGGAELVAQSTAEALADDDTALGVERLHTLLFEALREQAAQQALAERERVRRQTAADEHTLSMALRDVAVTLNPRLADADMVPTRVGSEGSQLTLEACRLVAEANGIQVVVPPAQPGQETKITLPLIARSSRFHTRQILLRDAWWKEASEPMLGLLQEEKRPIALLPRRRRGFRLHDPATGQKVDVDEAVAESLAPHAINFYRPFESQPIGGLDLARFGAKSSWRDFVTFLLMAAAAGGLSLITPIATRTIFNDIIPGAARGQLLQVTLILVVISIATAMFKVAGSVALVRAEGKSGAAIMAAVWDRLLSLPVPFYRPYTAGNLANRAMGVETMRHVLSGDTTQALVMAIFSMPHVGLLFYFSAPLAWWAVLLIAIAFLVTLSVGYFQTRAERKVNDIRNKLAGTVLQLLSSVSKLRVAGAEVQAFCQWANRFSQQRRYQLSSRSRGNLLVAFNAGFPVVANLVIFGLAFKHLGEGALRTGDFLAFIASFTTALISVLTAGRALTVAATVVPLFEDARPILRSLPEVDLAKASPGALTGAIDVHHLNFRYQEDGPLVLDDVSVSVRQGQFIALVGPSGSGKSTLLRLLLGFEKPLSGSVFFDGQDLDGLDGNAVRGQIGVVLQNARLMSGDIFSNIVGSSLSTADDAWAAARMAGLDADIKAMPMGMHTLLTEGGGTLSGGQRQRLMIARALVKKPRMLFFDEATSALDNRTQAVVTESLDGLQATRIVVAHRLSTIQNADRIVVLERGRVTEQGTYEELMTLGGTFKTLAERQMT